MTPTFPRPEIPPDRRLVRHAPAKINLHLRVGAVRGDGFHALLSWMTTVSLFDTLTFERQPAGGAGGAEPWFSLETDDAGLAVGPGNLVTRAALAVAERVGTRDRGGEFPSPRREDRVSAFLRKRIPAGAGLGGGSSDAAATLRAMNELLGARLSAPELASSAAGLGSDVPFFLAGPGSVCRGRGEIVRPVGVPTAARFAVLLLPRIGMPTPAVYRAFDDLGLGRDGDIGDEPDWLAWKKLPAAELVARLVNDLEVPAFALRPPLRDLRAEAEHLAGRAVRMSGSGSSLFTLVDDREHADALAATWGDALRTRAVAVEIGPPVADGPALSAGHAR